MIEEKFVRVTGPAQVYKKMDNIGVVLRRAESIVEELEEIKTRKDGTKALMVDEVTRMIADLDDLSAFLEKNEGPIGLKKKSQPIKPAKAIKPPKIVTKIPEVKPVLTSVKIKPKKDAKVEKEKTVLKSSLKDLKGELERLKKELKS